MTSAYYRGAVGAMLVYDVTRSKTFENVKLWMDAVREYSDNNAIILLVGNKTDLKD